MNPSDNNNNGMNNSISIDDNADKRDDKNKSSKKSSRTSNIYRRFINRVQQIESGNDTNSEYDIHNNKDDHSQADTDRLNVTESSAEVDLLNDNELHSFTDDGLPLTPHTKGAEGTSEEGLQESSGTTSKPSATPANTHSVRGKPVSSLKLLLTGIVCGLLLSASIVFILSSTGLLSSLTDSLAATAPPAPSTPAINTDEQPIKAAPAIDSETTERSTNHEETAKQAAALTTPTLQEEQSAQPNINTEVAAEAIDGDITYEDFREEAQNTLYREVND
jgi:hypothetical protein